MIKVACAAQGPKNIDAGRALVGVWGKRHTTGGTRTTSLVWSEMVIIEYSARARNKKLEKGDRGVE